MQYFYTSHFALTVLSPIETGVTKSVTVCKKVIINIFIWWGWVPRPGEMSGAWYHTRKWQMIESPCLHQWRNWGSKEFCILFKASKSINHSVGSESSFVSYRTYHNTFPRKEWISCMTLKPIFFQYEPEVWDFYFPLVSIF